MTDSFVSDDHAVGLPCYCWSYASRFQVEKKKSHILAETTLFWHLYMTAHLSPILTRTICRLAATVFKVSCGEKKVTYFGRNNAVLAFVHDCTSLTHSDTIHLWARSYTLKFPVKKSQILWKKDAVLAFVGDCTSLTHPGTKNCKLKATIKSFR